MSLLEVDPVLKMIKLTLQSGYIKNAGHPVNLLIVAKPESGKTSAMDSFPQVKGMYYTNNITQAVIVSKILPMIENEGLKHLLIPDLLNAIEKDYTTKKGFLNMTKTLIEEGITSLDTFNLRTHKTYDPAVKCGLITAITSESYQGYWEESSNKWRGGMKHEWRTIGLLSRFIPFSYQYELSKIGRIFEFIANGEQEETVNSKSQFKIKRKTVNVEGNPELFNKLALSSQKIGQEAGGYGFRLQRSLQSLAKANAVLNDRTEVTQEDIDTLLHLGNWMNYNFNPL
ncbi:MAG: hypothetical protein WAM95_10845 [Bacillus sp. (in: firmicutes)]